MSSRTKLILSVIGLLLLIPFIVSAHPGRTASDNCHYCRTNCDYWGELWNERHCHGEYVAPAPIVPIYTATATPQKTITLPSPVILTGSAIVKRVVDGDTIEVVISGLTKKVRLIGIDTPETVDPRKPVECFGKEASNRATQLLNGKEVLLSTDSIGDTIDNYGRLLRYVTLVNNQSLFNETVNEQLVREGYAYVYTEYPFSKMSSFVALELTAKENGMGLWAPGVCDIQISPSPSPNYSAKNIQENSTNWFIRFWKWVF